MSLMQTQPIKVSPQKRGKKRRISAGSIGQQGGGEDKDKDEVALSGGEEEDGAGGPATKKKVVVKTVVDPREAFVGTVEHRYATEISQMVYVFSEIQDPSEETVNLIEDIVRSQMIEIATRARLISHLRVSRYLTIEDVIFLIRDDRARVNRLRTYLSWKEVRRTAKKEQDSVAKGAADVDVDDLEDEIEKKPLKKEVIKLPWEQFTSFSEVLKALPGRQTEDDEEDEDELEAYEDTIQRLKEADSVTRKMSREQYVFYSECRQASFTYRKSKRFRDFINTSAYLDLKPNDDVVDVLGFLAFESVRSLCVTALQIRDAAAGVVKKSDKEKEREQEVLNTNTNNNITANNAPNSNSNSTTKDLISTTSPPPLGAGGGGPANDIEEEIQPLRTNKQGKVISNWKAPPTLPLLPAHILSAYLRMQKEQERRKSGGLRNWRGGARRGKLGLV